MQCRYVAKMKHRIAAEYISVEQISGQIWPNRGFDDKSKKTSKNVALDLLNKIGYGPIV